MNALAALGGLRLGGFEAWVWRRPTLPDLVRGVVFGLREQRFFDVGRFNGEPLRHPRAAIMPSGTVLPGRRDRKKVHVEADGLREFQAHRPRLFALAYRMLGSAMEAEDAVQEAYLRWDAADRRQIRSAEAWLTTVVVNICRNWLVSARARRETYAGPWLPEPVPTARGELGPLESVEEREQVSLALLTTLERLSPVERAVFVLREAFGYAHREIADMLTVTEANSQQVYRRAAQRVREGRTRFEIPDEYARELIERFLKAARTGDITALERMLTADAVSIADGGGVINAARRPVVGANSVARYLAGLFRWEVPGMVLEVLEINGAPSVVVLVNGVPMMVVAVELDGDQVGELRLVVNPEKLTYLARVWA
ncbi:MULTISPECIES: RNA polymerase sigma-70 factor [unclassified Nocardia]|uniref:RNA polymerase sigma-70 factor n=1 Tax=unclassified Nocardia TaxID=2637762 RepID=UPI001CE4403C|nr:MULTISPECIES: RNA polymerase sigma-70 factor [unclassified Nocardia]